jgi:soluble lytic murein transglycosylase-like protein
MELTRMIATASQKAGVDPELIKEVARQESAFRPCSVSDKGAEGLMQLMPATQAQFGVQDPMDPDQSLLGGAQLLRQLLLRYGGNVALALSAYNAGPTRVDKAGTIFDIDQIGGIPDIAETQDYVANIMGRLKR